MRLKRLDLLRYGHFTDRSLELTAGKSDFHIVFGSNEAGKSTALSAIEDFLFRIPMHSPYGFFHDYSSMRIGAAIENGTDALEALRRKGNKDTLLGSDGLPLSGGDGALRPYLAGADRMFFERMFSLDHKRLEAGGQEILEAKDDVGQMLFSAGAGIGGLRERLNDLTAEADDLWNERRAKRRKFYIAKDKLDEATRELRTQTLSAAKWRELKKAYEGAEEAYGTIDTAISEATKARNRLNRIRRVFRDVRRKQELDGLIDALGDVIGLPADAADLVAVAEQKDAEIDARIGTLKDQLQLAEEALGKLTYDETIIQRGADVRQICERRIEIRGEKADLPKREAELHAAESELNNAAAELGWHDESSTALIARIPPRPKISVVRSLLNQKGELENDVGGKARLLDEAKAEHTELVNELTASGEPANVSRLAIVLKTIREQGDIEGRFRTAEEGLRNAKDRVNRRLGALHPGVEDEVALTGMVVPATAKVQTLRDTLVDWQRRLKEAQQLSVSVQQEQQGAAAALEQELSEEQVITAEELEDARGHRDAVWHLLKLNLVDGQPIPVDKAEQYKNEIKDLPGTFAQSVVRADEMADRRFDHAAAAGRIVEIRRKMGERGVLLEQAHDNETRLVEEGAQLKAEWTALWANAPFKPETPETMLEWLENREEALGAIESREEAQSALDGVRVEKQTAAQQLLGELTALGIDVSSLEMQGLNIIIESAADELRICEVAAGKITQLEKSAAEADKLVSRRQQELELAEKAIEEWRTNWTEALGDLGLADDTAAEAVNAQIDIIDQMRETAGRITSLRDDRIEKIKVDVADFEKVVREMTAVIASDLLDATADEAVAKLEKRLDDAEEIQGQRERKSEDVESLKEQIVTLEGQQRELAASISHLKQTAGVEDNEKLKALIERSDSQRGLQEEQQEIVDKLQQDGDGKSVEELEAECEGLIIDEVMAQEESLDAELEDLRIQQGEAGEVRSQARQAFHAIGGDDTAAQAASAKEDALTEMGEVAERYVRVKTSAMLLQWAIDRYRREKQAPMLKRAGNLFQILTGGSFTALRVDFDDEDNAHLTGVRPDKSAVPVSGMSTGTADQLYLALRIASVEDYLDRADALPFVADDLFINFDEERAAAGFQLLGQLGEKTQVLFFTHHNHLVDIAQATLGKSINILTLN